MASALPGEKIELRGAVCDGRGTARLGRRPRRGDGIAVDVDAEVLAREDDRSIVGERHVEALRVLYAALERRRQLAVRREQSRIEVVVVVGDQDATHRVNADTDRIVRHTLAANLTQECTVISKYLNITNITGTY